MVTMRKIIFISGLLLALNACTQLPGRYHDPRKPSVNNTLAVNAAKAQLGTDYKFGGESPAEGFDCSGLVYYSFRQAGITLPRTAYGQLKRSRPIGRKHLTRGDLVFFRIYRSKVSHVGIYLGDSRFIHAPSTGKSVRIASLNNPYWQKRYIRAGRIRATGKPQN